MTQRGRHCRRQGETTRSPRRERDRHSDFVLQSRCAVKHCRTHDGTKGVETPSRLPITPRVRFHGRGQRSLYLVDERPEAQNDSTATVRCAGMRPDGQTDVDD